MAAIKIHPMTPVNGNQPQLVKEPIPGGYYIKARCIQDSAIAHAAPHVREIWDWLIKEANYVDRKTHGTVIRRGQVFTDFNEIIDALSWKEGFIKKGYKKHHVDYAMRWLREECMITTLKTTRGLIVTVCNYEYYQNAENYEKDNDYDTVTTRLRQPTATIQKKDKNTNKGIFVAPSIEEVTEYIKGLTDGNSNAGSVAQNFMDFYTSKGWKVGKTKMVDWQATVRNCLNWEKNQKLIASGRPETPSKGVDMDEYLGRPPIQSAFD